MSTLSADVTPKVSAEEVHTVLGQHMLVDGMHLVMDLEKSHGSYLFDDLRGHEVLDLFGAFSTIAIGYNHPKLSDTEFLKRLLPAALTKPSNSDIYTPQLAAFVEAFARTVPAAFKEHLFFIEGGALAVENALKAAFDWKVRKNLAAGRGELGHQIIHFRQAFHGRSGYTLSLTNTADPRKTQYFPKFKWPRITNPALSFPLTAEVEERVAEEEKKALSEIKQALDANPDDIAGLIIEPIQGEGGDNHFRPQFLQALRQLADENEFLLIFDEVQTGFGTSGKWWCFEHLGVEPDIFCFGKKTQVCGIAATRRLDEVESVFKVSSRINSTWGGNLVDMVRCRRIIEIVEEDDLLSNATEVGKVLLAGLQDLAQEYPGIVTNPRGRGLFLAFDLPDGEKRNRILAALNEADVLGLASGFRAIRFRPALTLDPETAREGLSRIGSAIAHVV